MLQGPREKGEVKKDLKRKSKILYTNEKETTAGMRRT